jgi:hypothetical protein
MDKMTKTEQVRGKIWVSRGYPKSSRKPDEEEQLDLAVRKFETEPAFVKAGYGLTINLGNYESARCDVGVTLPCYVEEITEAMKEAWKIAEEEIQKQRKAVSK